MTTIERNSEGQQVIAELKADENTKSVSPIQSTHDTWMLAMNDRIKSIAQAKMSKNQTQAWNLNTTKLVSSVVNDYRMHNNSEFGTGEAIPSNIYTIIRDAVMKFAQNKINSVHLANVVSVKSAYSFTDKKGFFLKSTVIGHDDIDIKEKILACVIVIERNEVALKQEYAKINSNPARIVELKQKKFKFEITLQQLRDEQKQLSELSK